MVETCTGVKFMTRYSRRSLAEGCLTTFSQTPARMLVVWLCLVPKCYSYGGNLHRDQIYDSKVIKVIIPKCYSYGENLHKDQIYGFKDIKVIIPKCYSYGGNLHRGQIYDQAFSQEFG